MTKDDLWNLFKLTGNINYYIKYKEISEKGFDEIGSNKSNRNNN